MNKLMFLCFFLLTSNLVHAMPPESFKDLGNGVYAGETKTKNGKTVYFGCELVDDRNCSGWMQYAEHAERMAGIISMILFFEADPLSLIEPGECSGKLQMCAEKLQKYYENIFRKQRCLNSICAAIAGFRFTPTGNFYVTYASKVPVIGRFDFNKISGIQHDSRVPSLEDFNEFYKNIIMCVVTKFFPAENSHPPHYRNHGIFRNPSSVSVGSYRDISLPLHGFSALVAQYRFNDIKYMIVSPLGHMQEIIVSALRDGEAFIGYNGYNKYNGKFPPLIHVNPNGQWTIAKEGVKVADYDGVDIPPEFIQYGPGEPYLSGRDYTSITTGGVENLIKVDALVRAYCGASDESTSSDSAGSDDSGDNSSGGGGVSSRASDGNQRGSGDLGVKTKTENGLGDSDGHIGKQPAHSKAREQRSTIGSEESSFYSDQYVKDIYKLLKLERLLSMGGMSENGDLAEVVSKIEEIYARNPELDSGYIKLLIERFENKATPEDYLLKYREDGMFDDSNCEPRSGLGVQPKIWTPPGSNFQAVLPSLFQSGYAGDVFNVQPMGIF